MTYFFHIHNMVSDDKRKDTNDSFFPEAGAGDINGNNNHYCQD
jgi:hypothetical protein